MRTRTSPALGASSVTSSITSGSPARRRTAARTSALLELFEKRVANSAVLEAKRVGERIQFVVVEATEQFGVLVGERLRNRDVEQQRTHPVEAAPRVRVEVR